jgi:hypothetical protein
MMVKEDRPALQVKVEKQWQYVACKVIGQEMPETTADRTKAIHGRSMDYFKAEFEGLRFRVERRQKPLGAIPHTVKPCEVVTVTSRRGKWEVADTTSARLDKIAAAKAKIAYAEQTPPVEVKGFAGEGKAYLTNDRVAWLIGDKMIAGKYLGEYYNIPGWHTTEHAEGLQMPQGHIVLKALEV